MGSVTLSEAELTGVWLFVAQMILSRVSSEPGTITRTRRERFSSFSLEE